MHLKQCFPDSGVCSNTFIIFPSKFRIVLRLFVAGMVWWQKLSFKGNTDSLKILVVRTANGEQVNINNLTSIIGNRSATMGIGKGGTKIDQH